MTTTTKRVPSKSEVMHTLLGNGWFSKPNSQHLYKERDGKLYRIKFQARTFRREVQSVVESTYGKSVSWVRLNTYKMKT